MSGLITSRSGIPYRILPTPAEADEAAAEMWAQAASAAQRDGGNASIALSGGSTPQSLHRLMASSPYREQVDWKRVEVFFGDERSVGADHTDSNFRMA
ncbi:6-phosphogluconolactonase, partial [Candidatus Sumerlaeota bacterium]|nr:6-phosphogluconolactonase [Candidatus Sumerlaeota bacterium]